jgi:phosphoglucomutase
MITASHNPAKYNGYKAYDAQGCQLTLAAAEAVLQRISALDIFDDVKYVAFDEALGSGVVYIPQAVNDAYLQAVLSERLTDASVNEKLKVVYTPLNGTGNKPVRKVLKMAGFSDIIIVKEQEWPDGNFPTCPYPNPEKAEALQLGLDLCKELASKGEAPDLLLATDPDCDRAGIAVYHDGAYQLLTGNEVGVLLLDFICQMRIKQGRMPDRPIAVKTIVTTAMTNAVAKEYGVEVVDVLTGFKFIGEQIKLLEDKNEENRFIFGYEESYGYLSKGYVRDKDAVNASLLICEMAAHYKSEGRTLADVLHALYEKHGYYKNHLLDFYFEGAQGMIKMAQIMEDFRNNPPALAAGRKVVKCTDYMVSGETGLPAADVLAFSLEDGSSFIVRPSGTEPKIKIYLSAKGRTAAESDEIIALLAEELQLA